MNPYMVGRQKKASLLFFQILYRADQSVVVLPTKYLAYKTRANASPNTVKEIAFSLCYYLSYLESTDMNVGQVFELKFDEQHRHFTDFLRWLKLGCHLDKGRKKTPNNGTCNAYLQDVFGWYQFLETEEEQFQDLKVLSSHVVSFVNPAGIRFHLTKKTFRGYLPEEIHKGKSIEEDNILILLEHCTNLRDQLLILLLAETGFRIGEMLGVYYTKDINYQKHSVRVSFREGNENDARAKNAEYREAVISPETFRILMLYLSENRELLKKTEHLFINLSGPNAGKPLNANAVYAMMGRLEEKTKIKVTPHMLRHYYANERRNSGWDLLLISQALGHRHLETTKRYLDQESDRLVETAEKYFEKHGSLYMAEKLL